MIGPCHEDDFDFVYPNSDLRVIAFDLHRYGHLAMQKLERWCTAVLFSQWDVQCDLEHCH